MILFYHAGVVLSRDFRKIFTKNHFQCEKARAALCGPRFFLCSAGFDEPVQQSVIQLLQDATPSFDFGEP